MKKRIAFVLVFISFLACVKEEAVPVVSDFDYEVFNNDFSIPVQVVFFNKTEGAEEYEWTFEGGLPFKSVNRNPGVIRYETKGDYTITLTGTNQDGSVDTKTHSITIDDPVIINFEVTNRMDTFSPATYAIRNTTTGATSYTWTFEGGMPASSTEQDPGEVVFTAPGNHTITLEVSNGRETYRLEKSITVAPFLVSDFVMEIAFEDDDYQVPVRVQLNNNSISATSYQWDFTGASMVTSTAVSPEILLTEIGLQTLTLSASNGKDTKTTTKTITTFANTNLRTTTDVRLGVNTAHQTNTTGAFYSLASRAVYSADQITPEIGTTIDLVFFGLNTSFTRNKFVNPQQLETTNFPPLENAKNTLFINSQERCHCTASLTPTVFDSMEDDTVLQGIVIEETPGGLTAFDQTQVPRIVLFQTADGRKGAIKIKAFISEGQDGYILVDIKVQKAVK